MKNRTSISLKALLITVMGTVIIVLFITIISLFYSQNSSISLKVAKEFGAVATSNIIGELEAYFVNAENALDSLYNIARSDIFEVTDPNYWYDVMSGFLESDVNINALYMADFNGNFYMAKRMVDNSISKRYVYRTESKIVSEWIHQNKENRFIFPEYSESSLEQGYDPRKRPWYQNANASNIKWTEPYIFFSDKILGITGTRKVNVDGFEGVISIDISLSYLADFIVQLPFSNIGATLISDNNDNIIAYHDIFLNNRSTLQQRTTNRASGIQLFKVDDYAVSSEIKYMLYNLSQRREQQVDQLDKKSIVRILTDILFPSSSLNSLGNININSNTFTDIFSYEGSKYIYTSVNMNTFNGIDWNLIFVLEDTTLVGDFYNTLKLGIVLLTIMFIIALVLYSRLTQNISDKIGDISDLMGGIISLQLDNSYKDNQSKMKVTEIKNIGEVYNRVIKSLSSFKKFVPQEVIVDSIQKNTEISLRMEHKKNISILFSDIVSFTSITENFSPLQLSDALSIYFTEMCNVIADQNGIIDKFIGDAIMALFGVFDENENHAEQACLAALKMQLAHKIINEKIASLSGIRFATRIGVNSGHALVGVLGSVQKFNFSVLGDTVNVTSRLEGLNKEYSTKILISETTKSMLGPEFKYKALEAVQLKGKKEFTSVYQLFGYVKQGSSIEEESSDSTVSDTIEKTIEENSYGLGISDPIDALLREDEGEVSHEYDTLYFDSDEILDAK